MSILSILLDQGSPGFNEMSFNHKIKDPVSSHNVLNNQININARGKKEVEVTVAMKTRDWWKYSPGGGINKVLYDQVEFETTFEPRPGIKNRIVTQNVARGELNIMLTASAVHPDPLARKYKEDLDRELTRLKVVSDSLNEKLEPNLLKGSIKHQKHIGFVNDPGIDEIDSIRKWMQNHRDVIIDQPQYNRIKSHMERYQNVYARPSNAQAVPRFLEEMPDRNPHSGFKQFYSEVAEW